jgi:hypothetical protein
MEVNSGEVLSNLCNIDKATYAYCVNSDNWFYFKNYMFKFRDKGAFREIVWLLPQHFHNITKY